MPYNNPHHFFPSEVPTSKPMVEWQRQLLYKAQDLETYLDRFLTCLKHLSLISLSLNLNQVIRNLQTISNSLSEIYQNQAKILKTAQFFRRRKCVLDQRMLSHLPKMIWATILEVKHWTQLMQLLSNRLHLHLLIINLLRFLIVLWLISTNKQITKFKIL